MTSLLVRAKRIFAAALEVAESERPAFLDEACGDDQSLREQVDRLLSAFAAADEFLAGGTDAGATATPSDELGSEQPGDRIDRYKLLQQIGEGGMGTVWMAEQVEPVRRKVALKVIKLGMDTREVVARFEAERQALALMDHPNIAKVLDGGSTPKGRPYFVMELVKGVPITEFCDGAGLRTTERLEVFQAVCHAVQHAHQKGVIHRDLKPGNVLVTLHDGEPVPKVIDFGIAKATSAELTQKTLFTEFKQMVGTPEYMAPEQAELSGLDIDTRADVYSLGVLLYELLTGTKPFELQEALAKGYGEMLRVIREDDPPKPSTRISTLGAKLGIRAYDRPGSAKQLSRRVRGDLDWIVMRALEKDRTRRYVTAHDLGADIERHLHHQPVLAGPPGAGYRLRKYVRRHRAGVVAASLVFIALTAGLTLAAWGIVEAKKNEEHAKKQTTRAERQLARANEFGRFLSGILSGITPRDSERLDTALLERILDEASERLVDGKVEHELAAAELHTVVGRVYSTIGNKLDAERHLPVAAKSLTRLLGRENAETREANFQLAMLRHSRGNYREAQRLFREQLELETRLLGADHLHTGAIHFNLGKLLLQQARPIEAEPFVVEALRIRRLQLGDDHLDTLQALEALFQLRRSQCRVDEVEAILQELLDRSASLSHMDQLYLGVKSSIADWRADNPSRFAEAEALYRELLDEQLAAFGEDHSNVAFTRASFAKLLSAMDRHEKAEAGLRAALDILERTAGVDAPNTLIVRSYLADALSRTPQIAAAKAEYRELIETSERKLGPEHPTTLAALRGLADLALRLCEFEEAESLYRDYLERSARIEVSGSPTIWLAQSKLGHVLFQMGQRESGARMMRQALEALERFGGEASPDTLIAASNYSHALFELDRFDAAEELQTRTLELLTRRFGEDHDNVLRMAEHLALTYLVLGRLEESEAMYASALERYRRVFGEDHSSTVTCEVNYTHALRALGKLDEAERLLRRAFEFKLREFGPDHLDTVAVHDCLAKVFYSQRRYDEAAAAFVDIVAVRERTIGPDHPLTLEAMGNLATIYSSLGRSAEAQPMLIKVLETKRESLGPDASGTATTMINLAASYLGTGNAEAAAPLLEEAIEVQRRNFGESHESIGRARLGLFHAYQMLGRSEDAAALQTQVFEAQVAAAEAPGAQAQQLNAAAWALLTQQPESLRDPARALPLAERAAQMLDGLDDASRSAILDTLALAQHQTGDTATAVETQRRAIAALPAGADPSELQSRLAEFEASIKER